MNSTECVSKVLERIVENMHSFEEGESITNLLKSVCKIGSFALKKSLPCLLLRNVFLILQHFQPSHSLDSPAVTTFVSEAHHFYKTKKLCQSFKLVFLSCFPPAVETEVLHLLNICTKIKIVSELPSVESAILQSALTPACIDNPDMLIKTNLILKHCFNITKGNPVVGYLISSFNKTITNRLKPTDNACWFSEKLSYLEVLFSLPHSLLYNQQKLIYFRQVMLTVVDSVEKNLCEENEMMFLMVIFPSLFHQVLVLHNCHNNQTFDAFKFLRIVYNMNGIEGRDFRLKVDNILKNPVWKYLLESS